MMARAQGAVMAPQYYGTVYYYACIDALRDVVIDLDLRYDKRFKSVHRCTIVDTRGKLDLTVPVSKIDKTKLTPGKPLRWRDIRVSPHGQWWADHRVSLESAYGRTPFFEFYIDLFAPWLSNIDIPVTELCYRTDVLLRRALGIETRVRYVGTDVVGMDTSTRDEVDAMLAAGAADLRRADFSRPDACSPVPVPLNDVEYYQVRAHKLGFTAGVSALDLLFNMGPESPLVLRAMHT